MSETIAALDIGTNSLHMLVARTTSAGRFEVVAKEKEVLRLGAGPAGMEELDPAALERAIDALTRFRRVADSHGATLRAVATSAVREAANRRVIIDRAEAEAGVVIEVISGVEEARLIHLGVLQGLEVFDRRLLLIDIGGGSTELLVGERGEVLDSTSLKLGAVRLTRNFFPDGRVRPKDLAACRSHVRSTLAAFERSVESLGHEVAIASSGTAQQVLRLARGLEGCEPLRSINGATLTRKQIRRVVAALVDAAAEGSIGSLPDLDSKRADIILAGALVLEGIVEAFGIKELLLSDHALREGVLLDTIQRGRDVAHLGLRDVARRSIVDMLNAWDPDPAHSEHVTHLALGLFDATAERHGLGTEARALLEAGSLLANVGLVIAHSQHHKHSYYLIRNADRLVGFNDREVELVAQIARYHRRSAPKPSHPEWAALDDTDRNLVSVAAGILRVAVGGDRSRHRAVIRIDAEDRGGNLCLTPVTLSDDREIDLERWAISRRVDLLSSALGVPVTVD